MPNPKKTLRIAVVGVGWAGSRQIEAIRELGRDEISVECLVDADPDHLAERADIFGVDKTYLRIEEALDDPAVDAVSICLPHNLHCDIAIMAAQAGKHILCEKPLAMSVAEGERMIASAKAGGVTLFVAENEVYTPKSRFLRDVVLSGRFVGELTYAVSANGFRAERYSYPGRRDWLADPNKGGTGTWMLHGIHSVAQLRYVLGEVVEVYVREHKASSFARRDVEGTMSGLLTMESGLQVSMLQTCETGLPAAMDGFTLHGDQGSLRALAEHWEAWSHPTRGTSPTPVAGQYPDDPLSSYAREIEAFAETVWGMNEGPTTAESELRTLAVIEAGYESARTGLPVRL